MNKKKQLALAEKIEADNAIFEQADNAGKRMIIAQDCIERIKMKQLKTYPSCFLEDLGVSKSKTNEVSIKTLLNTDAKFTCKGCAKGGLFLSYVGRVNKCNLKDVHYGNGIESPDHQKLLEIFEAEQLSLIEYAFEGMQHITKYESSYIIFTDSTEEKTKDFFITHGGRVLSDGRVISYEMSDLEDSEGEELADIKLYFKQSDERLIAICKNIIKNKGTFIP